jgi:hypothetical protein
MICQGLTVIIPDAIRAIDFFLNISCANQENTRILRVPKSATGKRVANSVRPKRATDGIVRK